MIRGSPIPIDQARQTGFDDAIKGSNVTVPGEQHGNWSRDDAVKVMQDFPTKSSHIDVVWCQDDGMGVGVLEATKQAWRNDIRYIIGGAGPKQFIKKMPDGDTMAPVGVLHPDTMVTTAMEITAVHQPGRRGRHVYPRCHARDAEERERILLPRLAAPTGRRPTSRQACSAGARPGVDFDARATRPNIPRRAQSRRGPLRPLPVARHRQLALLAQAVDAETHGLAGTKIAHPIHGLEAVSLA